MALVTLDELRELAELCMRSDIRTLEEFPAAALRYLDQQREEIKQEAEKRRLYRKQWEEVNRIVWEILEANPGLTGIRTNER